MYDAYLNPKDALRPIAVALEAAQFIALDPENTDLAHELIAWHLKQPRVPQLRNVTPRRVKMLNLNTWNLFTLPLNGGAAETAPDDLRLLTRCGGRGSQRLPARCKRHRQSDLLGM